MSHTSGTFGGGRAGASRAREVQGTELIRENNDLVLGNILRKQARAYGRSTFLKLRGGELTFGDVDAAATRLARGFAALGVRSRDHVAIMLPNCADFVHVTFALAKLGAVLVPVNTAYKDEILRHVLATSDASMLVVDESLLDQAAGVMGQVRALKAVVVRAGESAAGASGRPLPKLDRPAIAYASLLNHGTDEPRAVVKPSDLQAVMYTSGTTGPSKGVIAPHGLGLICAEDSMRYLAYEPGETIYCPIPLFHAGALWDGMMVALLLGSPIAIVERFSASRFWNDVRTFGANVAMGIFSMIPILLKQPPTPADRDHTLRAFYLGKSSLDEEFNARFGVRAVETYTSTEAGLVTGSPYGEWRTGSCGQVNHDSFEVEVFDEHDRPAPPGEHGEIVVRPRRPFSLFPGYYNYSRESLECFRNLWFHTGDRAYRDDDGYFYFVERIKDVIRRRGENISAFEVEQVVNAHPSVLESAAFAVPSELEEDEVKIAVVLQRGVSLTPEELSAFCKEHLPSFMVPRYIEFLDELPKTPIGKLAKHELRARGDKGLTPKTWTRK